MSQNRRHSPEQIASLLRQIGLAIANGKNAPEACYEVGIAEYTYYRWRGEFWELRVDQIKRMKDLKRENMNLKRLVAELSLD